jgi:hypothetical protein
MCGDESFADDLILGQGTVSSRVALLLRSAEVKPYVLKIFVVALHWFRAGPKHHQERRLAIALI